MTTFPDAVSVLITWTEFLNKQHAHSSYGSRRISLVDPVTPFKGDSHRDKFAEVKPPVSEQYTF
jgi:hypothetical protein